VTGARVVTDAHSGAEKGKKIQEEMGLDVEEPITKQGFSQNVNLGERKGESTEKWTEYSENGSPTNFHLWGGRNPVSRGPTG